MRTEPSAEVSGSTVAQGELGDTRARDWAKVQESMALPFYEAVLGKTAIRPIVLEGSAVNGRAVGIGEYARSAASPELGLFPTRETLFKDALAKVTPSLLLRIGGPRGKLRVVSIS